MVIAQEIETRLRNSFTQISVLKITDLSDRHIGHTGHDGRGESHFKILIVSEEFKGLPRILRHRKVYEILGDLMKKRVHAMALDLRISAEYQLQDDNL